MAPIITIDRLKIYRHYGGDIDGLLRIKKQADLNIFGPDVGTIWAKISSFIQDIELIENGLASLLTTITIIGFTIQILRNKKATNFCCREADRVRSIDLSSLKAALQTLHTSIKHLKK